MTKTRTIHLKTLEDTQKIAQKIATEFTNQKNLFLFGNIGAGKTTFTKFLAEALGLSSFRIKSPTYTYIRQYQLENKQFYHIDLYRIEEFDDLMLQELSEIIDKPNNLVVIEWPEKLKSIIPKTRTELHFSYQADDSRKLEIFEY